MSTFKRTKVVMLPAKEKAPLWFYSYSDNKIPHPQLSKGVTLGVGDKYAHLYFLSDDEIEEGDWVLHEGNPIFQFNETQRAFLCHKCKKIIATTDRLYIGIESVFNSYINKYLPEPSQGFIQKYCEKGGIDEVMVEYEKLIIPLAKNWNDSLPVIKVSSDNTITIKPIKDSWNREEVEEFGINLLKRFTLNTECEPEDSEVEEYFKKNL